MRSSPWRRQGNGTDGSWNANRWALETVGDPRYPLDLFLRVATVSLETNAIVSGLPAMEI